MFTGGINIAIILFGCVRDLDYSNFEYILNLFGQVDLALGAIVKQF